jgi:hypothetical protein
MSIKVMKSGRAKNLKPYPTKCNNCSCEFSFEKNDCKFSGDQRDGDFVTVICPECSEPVHVSFNLTGWVY